MIEVLRVMVIIIGKGSGNLNSNLRESCFASH